MSNQEMEMGNLLFGNSRGSFHVDRKHQGLFYCLMQEIENKDPNFDPSYGYSSTQYEGKRIGFRNETFLIRSYYWGECDCEFEDKLEELAKTDPDKPIDFDHAEDCSLVLDNFKYFPLGYTLQWYKYPLRDSYANKDLTSHVFITMINECIKSLKG